MADRENEKKKKGHTGSKLAGAAVLLALLGGGGYFGLGIGNEGGGFLNPTQPKSDPSAYATTAEEVTTPASTETEPYTEEEEGVITLTVKEDKILYRGEEMGLKELEEALLKDYKDGVQVRVVNDHAILSVYDELDALLKKLKITPEAQTP